MIDITMSDSIRGGYMSRGTWNLSTHCRDSLPEVETDRWGCRGSVTRSCGLCKHKG